MMPVVSVVSFLGGEGSLEFAKSKRSADRDFCALADDCRERQVSGGGGCCGGCRSGRTNVWSGGGDLWEKWSWVGRGSDFLGGDSV